MRWDRVLGSLILRRVTLSESHKITIKKQFCGPPNSGNGGYTSGLIAKHFQGDVEVRLLQPPPLDTELDLLIDTEGASLFNQDIKLAQAKPTALNILIPKAVSLQEAQHATKQYIDPEQHLLPTCFVCGPLRNADDGLNIFAGPTHLDHQVAAPWQPKSSLANSSGQVKSEFIWAALDCPGYFAINRLHKISLLGCMSGSIKGQVFATKNYIVQAWLLHSEGRKHFTGTAIFDEQGELCAASSQIWIELKDATE